MLDLFIVILYLVNPSRFLSIFPSNWLYINNNNNAIYAPMDDDRPCFSSYFLAEF